MDQDELIEAIFLMLAQCVNGLYKSDNRGKEVLVHVVRHIADVLEKDDPLLSDYIEITNELCAFSKAKLASFPIKGDR
jgi:hypothetical protein